jgi:hypothetical protein
VSRKLAHHEQPYLRETLTHHLGNLFRVKVGEISIQEEPTSFAMLEPGKCFSPSHGLFRQIAIIGIGEVLPQCWIRTGDD